MRCSMCHEVNGIGKLRPPLTGLGSQAIQKRSYSCDRQPFTRIAHGFGGTGMYQKWIDTSWDY